MKSIIYLDMDGVLADFEGKAKELIDDWKYEIELPSWGKFQEHPRIFSLLDPMPDALELYEGCCSFLGDKNRVQVLTALPNRVRFNDAARDKIEWARKHISPHVRVHFGPYAQDKQYHQQHPHDVLIDDVKLNINQWINMGGVGILHVSASSSLSTLLDNKLQMMSKCHNRL